MNIILTPEEVVHIETALKAAFAAVRQKALEEMAAATTPEEHKLIYPRIVRSEEIFALLLKLKMTEATS